MFNISEEWNEHIRNVLMPNTVWLLVVMVFGVAGNSLVLYVYTSKMKGTLEDRYFIPILGVLDLICSIAVPMFLISDSLYWVAFTSVGVCKVFFFLGTLFPGASSHILLLIALQRYLKICRPTGKQMDLFWKRVSIGIVLTSSVAYAAPLLHYYDIVPVAWTFKGENVTGTMCIMSTESTDGSEFFYVGTLFIITFGNIVATVALYAPIGYVIYKRFKPEKNVKREGVYPASGTDEESGSTRTSDLGSSDTNSSHRTTTIERVDKEDTKQKRNEKVKTNFNHMFFAIVLFYILFNLPTFIFIFIVRAYDNFWFSLSDAGLGICVFISRTFVLNHVVNPVIYGYFDVRFRSEIKKIRIFCWRTKTIN